MVIEIVVVIPWSGDRGLLQFFSLDIILKFLKTVILEFPNSLTQTLVFFLSREIVGWVMGTKYFLDECLGKQSLTSLVALCSLGSINKKLLSWLVDFGC